jgi:alpha-galactosidase
VWIGWQFDRPEADGGCVQVFRRQNAASGSITLKLNGLDATKSYDVRNFDSTTQRLTGQSLMTTGLTVSLPARGSAIFEYKVVIPPPQPVTSGRPRYRPPTRSFGF